MEPTTNDLQAQLDKLIRRQERNQRAAAAKGLMQGILSMLQPSDVVLDCGANVGDVTNILAQSGAHIHAFEPDPFAFGKLHKRFGKTENVTLYNVAVGLSKGTAQLMRADNFDDNPKGASVKSTIISGGRKIVEDNTIDVPIIDLPDLLKNLIEEHGSVAFMKMDIEGAELDILEHMHANNLFENIRLTVAETHENKFKELRPRFAKLREDVTEAYPITKVNLDWI